MRLTISTLSTLSTIFGSHDSASWHLNTSSPIYNINYVAENLLYIGREFLHLPLGNLARKWSQTQSLNITEQLNRCGVRYIDLRVMRVDDTWYTCHGLLGLDVQHTIDQIDQANFVDDLIIEVSSYTWPVDDTLCTMFNKLNGYNIFGPCPGMLPATAIHNTFANTAHVKNMVEYNKRQVLKFNNGVDNDKIPKKLFKMSWTLTPKFSTMVKSFVHAPYSMHDLARSANNAWLEFKMWCINQNLTLPHVVIFDYVDMYSATDSCIN